MKVNKLIKIANKREKEIIVLCTPVVSTTLEDEPWKSRV